MCTYDHAIHCFSTYGPPFETGDICILCGINSNQNSYSYFGNSYELAVYQNTDQRKLGL